MGSFIAKQPNGLYCRFSTVVDCPTHYNMTKEDYINDCCRGTKEEALDILENYLYSFSEVERRFAEGNMTKKEFEQILKEMHEECTDGYRCP